MMISWFDEFLIREFGDENTACWKEFVRENCIEIFDTILVFDVAIPISKNQIIFYRKIT